MSDAPAPRDQNELHEETRTIWNENAVWWDSKIGEGNGFHKVLIEPAADRLLALQPGEQVLEVACGNGAYARHMANQGVNVVATDFSDVFIARAKERTVENAERITYLVVDATDEAQLLALGEQRFDAVVCNMALMDMTVIEPLLAALRRLLRPGGRFVFSVMHPCFNSNGSTKVAEEEDRDGLLRVVYAVKVSRYIQPWTERGIGIVGQPSSHYYFHRPISVLFNACFQAGFALDGLEEPVDTAPNRVWHSWGVNYAEIPPALVVRMRLHS